jgi:hypothetical protein
MYRLIDDSVNRLSTLTINPEKSFHTVSVDDGRHSAAVSGNNLSISRRRHRGGVLALRI